MTRPFKQIDNGYDPVWEDVFESGVQAGKANWNVVDPRVDKGFVKVYMPLFGYISDGTLDAFRAGFNEGRRRAGGTRI